MTAVVAVIAGLVAHLVCGKRSVYPCWRRSCETEVSGVVATC